MRAVNLLPADRRKGAKGARGERGQKFTKLHGIGLAILVAGGALGYWGHGIAGQAGQAAAEAGDLEAQVTALNTQIAAEKAKAQATPQAGDFEADKLLVTGLAQARINWSNVIVNLSRVAPSSVWLESIRVDTPTADPNSPATGDLPTAITLSGQALSRTAAVQFISRLDAIPGFEEPKLSGGINPAEGADGGPTLYSFDLNVPINDGIFGPIKPGSSRQAQPAATTSTSTTSGANG